MSSTIDLDEIIKALAHPERRQMLAHLKEPEVHFPGQDHSLEMGVCAGQFVSCGLSQSTVSAHLAVLQRAQLVTCRKLGQWSFFKRNEEVIAKFLVHIAKDL